MRTENRNSLGQFVKGHSIIGNRLGSVGPWHGKTRPDMASRHSGEGNPMWKGEKVGVKGMHLWLRRNFEQAKCCEHCGDTNKTRYDWALIAGKDYERKRENFMSLCRSCHQKYDFKHGMRTPTRHTPEVIERIKQTRLKNAHKD